MQLERIISSWRGARSFLKPAHLGLIWRDLRGVRESPLPDEDHLALAIRWLCRSQDQTGCGGSSGGYRLGAGWRPPYPETTGYIISTFVRYADLTGEPACLERACRMGDWEISIQLPDGGVQGGHGETGIPIVFNTGQVIFGWLSLYRVTRNPAYLEAARRAADWLCSIQEEDGSWVRHTFMDTPHAYNTRVDWSLLEVAELTGEAKYQRAAERNVKWVLRHVEPNGWIQHMGFHPLEPVYTHTIEYTLRGLAECAPHLDEGLRRQVLWTASRSVDAICRAHRLSNGIGHDPRCLPGELGPDWEGLASYSCLTGNAQMALVLMRLDDLSGTPGERQKAADRLVDSVKAAQVVRSGEEDLDGGLAGSYPLWGGYKPWTILNWATKFLADALMLRVIRRKPAELGVAGAALHPEPARMANENR